LGSSVGAPSDFGDGRRPGAQEVAMQHEQRSAFRSPSPLRLRRLSSGITLDEVAHRIGCSPSHLSRAERGFTDLTPELSRRLDKILKKTE
jgi:AraC-like DNA-binding protein